MVHDTLRLCQQGIRDFVMEVYCALHHVRVRLIRWHVMVSSKETLYMSLL
jgi:hypothetical protein